MDAVTIAKCSLLSVEPPDVKVNLQATNHKDSRSKILKNLVCWYSPIKQGCTNSLLSNEPVLRDLSGNGRDMELKNFSFNQQSGIASDGSLRFDGIDDWCKCRGQFAIQDFTLFINLKNANRLQDGKYRTITGKSAGINSGAFIVCCEFTNEHGTQDEFAITIYRATTCVLGKRELFQTDGTVVVTPSRFANLNYDSECISLTRGDKPDTPDDILVIGRIRPSDAFDYAQMNLFDYILFDRTLTDKEIQWVYDNMIKR